MSATVAYARRPRTRRFGARFPLAGLSLALLACAACGPPTADVERTFTVAHVSPHHGAVDVSTVVEPVLGFSSALAPDSLDAIELHIREADGFEAVDVATFLGADNLSVRLVPRTSLPTNTEAEVRVLDTIRAEDGGGLGSEFRSAFATGAD